MEDYCSRSQGSKRPRYEGEPFSKVFTGTTSNNHGEVEPWNVFGNGVHGIFPKWTDEMVRLLITAVSYVMEAAVSSEYDDKTRWKVISTVMLERGYNVSPQHCEEKFNEIKKKYMRMLEILGPDMSCDVVENPLLLESAEIVERQKEEVRRLMSSDQFLYREMCSLRNGNRLFLPHDWEIRRFVFSSFEGNNNGKQHKDQEGNLNDCRVLKARWIRLEEKKLELLQQKLQLEKEKLDWKRLNYDEELKLEEMRLENERLNLANERMAIELKRRETVILDDDN